MLKKLFHELLPTTPAPPPQKKKTQGERETEISCPKQKILSDKTIYFESPAESQLLISMLIRKKRFKKNLCG